MALDGAQMDNQSLLTGHLDRVRGRAFTVHQANKAGAESGTVNGVKFVVDEIPDQKVMDSLDEVRRRFADLVEKPIGGHQLGEKFTAMQQYFTAVGPWTKIFPEMPGDRFIEGRLTELRQRMNDRPLVLNAEQLLKMVASVSAGPSVRYAVLQSFKERLDPSEVALTAIIDEAIATLLRESGRQILTEVNISKVVNESATTAEELQSLRDLYQSEVDGFENPQECFKSLLAKRGPERITESLDFLTESLGADLNSEMPSRDPERLGDILTQLKQVAIIKTVYADAEQLVSRMSKEFGETPKMNAQQTTEAILKMAQDGAVTKETVSAFISQLGVQGAMAQLDCCREFQGLVRRLSSGVFTKESDRTGIVSAAQDLMDDLIDIVEGEPSGGGGTEGGSQGGGAKW